MDVVHVLGLAEVRQEERGLAQRGGALAVAQEPREQLRAQFPRLRAGAIELHVLPELLGELALARQVQQGMAERGASYKAILHKYYNNISLEYYSNLLKER